MMHDDIRDLLGAYALDALTVEERDEVDSHLSNCATCPAEAADLRSAADGLALLVAEREPPAALRTRLVNLVELDRREWLREQAEAAAQRAAQARRIPWWKRWSTVAAGAGAALAVAAVLLIVVLANRNTVTLTPHRNVVVVAQVVKGIVVGKPAAVIGVRSDHTIDVTFTHMPVLPPSLAYELWLIPVRGAPVPVAGFTVGQDHSFSRHYKRDASGFGAAAVSIERAPGNQPSPSPGSVAIEVPLGA